MIDRPARAGFVPASCVCLLLLVVAGCSRPAEQPAEDAPAVEAKPAVAVEVIDEAGFREVLRQHRGKVVLVDYWATWCEPCRELFPHTVELHRRLAGQGLAVISVSFDDPEDEPAVRKFLVDRRAAFPNFISAYGAGTKSMEAFRVEGGVPYFQLYDRQGKLQKTLAAHAAPIEPAQIDRAVEELLGGSELPDAPGGQGSQ